MYAFLSVWICALSIVPTEVRGIRTGVIGGFELLHMNAGYCHWYSSKAERSLNHWAISPSPSKLIFERQLITNPKCTVLVRIQFFETTLSSERNIRKHHHSVWVITKCHYKWKQRTLWVAKGVPRETKVKVPVQWM